MDAPIVRRGRITNFTTKQFLEFALNPSVIEVGHDVAFADDMVPGFSHSLRRWNGGRAEMYKFSLELDGHFTQDRFDASLQNDLNPTPDSPYCIQGELDFYESFNLPTDPSIPGGDGAAPLAVFTFGSRFRGVLCDIAVAKIDIKEFDPNLNPVRASLNVALARRVFVNEFSHQRFMVAGV